jgi:SWIM zinc finger
MSGTAKLTHGGRFLTVTVPRKKGRKSVDLVQTYVVEDTRPDVRVANPAFTLTKEDGEQYHCAVNEFGPTCSCADCEFRQHLCKHLKAVIAVGLLPSRMNGAE